MLPRGHGSEEFYLLELTTYTLVTWLGRGCWDLDFFFFWKKMGCESLFDLGEDGDIYYVPGTLMTSIFEGQPPKTRPFPIKTRVIWVLGLYMFGWFGWCGLVGWCVRFLGGGLPPLLFFLVYSVVENVEHQNMWSFFNRTSALKFETTPWMFNLDPENLPGPKGKVVFQFHHFSGVSEPSTSRVVHLLKNLLPSMIQYDT